jgi:uncharacterized membrane protein YbhN (UPF0104 family)
VAVLTGCVLLLSQQGETVLASIRRLNVAHVVVSGVLAVAATMCLQQVWRSLLRGFGIMVGGRDAATAFYVSQLGKYVPGAVWPVVVQVELGARWSVPRRVMLAVGLQLILVVTGTGIIAGALLLPSSSPDGIARYAWLLALLPLVLVALHPPVLTHLFDWLTVRTGGQALGAQVSVSGLVWASSWAGLAWLLLGAHVAVLISAFSPVGPIEVAAAVGGMGLAWAAGIAFVPAPAGAGVREGVLVVVLGPLIGHEPALAVAVASRALLVVADVALAVAVAGRRTARSLSAARARRSAPDRGDSASTP